MDEKRDEANERGCDCRYEEDVESEEPASNEQVGSDRQNMAGYEQSCAGNDESVLTCCWRGPRLLHHEGEANES